MVQELVGVSREMLDGSDKSHFQMLNQEFLGNVKKVASVANEMDLQSDNDESGEDSDKPEMTNTAIDRSKKLTKTQRNQKIRAKANRDLQDQMTKKRKADRQYDNIGIIIGEDAKEARLQAEKLKQIKQEE